MLRRLNSFLLMIPISLVVAGCSSKDTNPEPPIPEKTNRTVIVYLPADNNLYSNLLADINEMEYGFSDAFDGEMLVYLYPRESSAYPGGTPKLLRIRHDEDMKKINSPVLKEYKRSEDPLSPTVMKSVLLDAMAFAPAQHYGLCFGSHATGWYPASAPLLTDVLPFSHPNYGKELPMTRTFGQIYTHQTEMEIPVLVASALPDGVKFDFIMFDACLMGGIEVAYELRDRADYVIASSAEILATGFPYTTVVPLMFKAQADVKGMAEEFHNYYMLQEDVYQSATIGVVQCDKLALLAAATRKVIESNLKPIIDIDPIYRFKGNLSSPVWFDFEDYVTRVWADSPDLPAFQAALTGAMYYQAATPNYFDLPITAHCGVTSFIPQTRYATASMIYASDYKWVKDTGMDRIVKFVLGQQ